MDDETINLPAELTIYTVGEQHPRLLALVTALRSHDASAADDACLTLQADRVAEIDAAGVQLLLSLANTLKAESRSLRLEHPSAALRAACEALGAQALVEDGVPAEGRS